MTAIKYTVVVLFVVCLYVAGQRLNNATREYQSERFFDSVEVEKRDRDSTLNAIGVLKYGDVFGHTAVVNPYLLGYYYYSLVFDESDTQKLAYYYDNAYQLFVQTISQQPTNAKAWANLALLGWLNTQSPQDIVAFAQRAHMFGKYNFRIHVKMSQLALWISQSYPHIDTRHQLIMMLKHHLKYGLEDRRSRQAIREMINNEAENKKVICSWLEEAERKQLRCNKTN